MGWPSRVGSLVLAFGLLVSAFPAPAQVELNGSVSTDYRVRARGDHRLTWNENRLDLKVQADLSDKAHGYGEIWLRSFGFPAAAKVEELQYRDRRYVLPWALDLREAYVDVYGFLLPNLDIRIGKQRIAWGTADKINPTDNLNPKDFEDPLDFGRKVPVNALRLNAYFGDWTVELDYVPVFTPAVLPPPGWHFGEMLGASPGIGLSNDLALPPATLKEGANFGAKISALISGFDLSASYAFVRDDIPLPTRVVGSQLIGGFQPTYVELRYPRLHVFGADVAGEIRGVGVWAEAAAFLPREEVTRTVEILMPGFPGPPLIRKESALERKAYLKWVAGLDYTFRNGIYLNGQFVHGFYGERGRAGLQDYIMGAVERKFLRETIKLRIGWLFQAKEILRPEQNYTWIVLPEVSYYPTDAVELILGGYRIGAAGESTLAPFEGNDEVYVKVKVSF